MFFLYFGIVEECLVFSGLNMLNDKRSRKIDGWLEQNHFPLSRQKIKSKIHYNIKYRPYQTLNKGHTTKSNIGFIKFSTKMTRPHQVWALSNSQQRSHDNINYGFCQIIEKYDSSI